MTVPVFFYAIQGDAEPVGCDLSNFPGFNAFLCHPDPFHAPAAKPAPVLAAFPRFPVCSDAVHTIME